MKKLAACVIAGSAAALALSLSTAHAAETSDPVEVSTVSTKPLAFPEALPADVPVTLPYCADGVTETPADGSCVPYVGLVETRPMVETLWPPVTSLDEALAQCTARLSGVDETDCTDAAYASFSNPAYIELDPQEDEPGWDCRTMGNQQCGVDIMGTWYVVEFIDGSPYEVYVR